MDSQENSSKMSSFIQYGGCSQKTRGKASEERSRMEKEKIWDSDQYKKTSSIIHCQDFESGDNCKNAQGYKQKY